MNFWKRQFAFIFVRNFFFKEYVEGKGREINDYTFQRVFQDVNDYAPVFSPAFYAVQIMENSAEGLLKQQQECNNLPWKLWKLWYNIRKHTNTTWKPCLMTASRPHKYIYNVS